ncbi:hypothetical protein SmJEL517_g00384 [Synchytrium microbalum]|uniref:Uncharacterized protein n=1 Tax=Synchytrium microbalum TaxID=1806994 RepID=A0A507CK98_9FUNG|nr:hypothetical protein SmJEL517_g00384 [Synchytrium microbalum]
MSRNWKNESKNLNRLPSLRPILTVQWLY